MGRGARDLTRELDAKARVRRRATAAADRGFEQEAQDLISSTRVSSPPNGPIRALLEEKMGSDYQGWRALSDWSAPEVELEAGLDFKELGAHPTDLTATLARELEERELSDQLKDQDEPDSEQSDPSAELDSEQGSGEVQEIVPADPEYIEAFAEAYEELPEELRPVPDPEAKVRVPTMAQSSFIANQAQGEWAEDVLKRAINDSDAGQIAVPYGQDSSLVAGDQGFAELYRAHQEEVKTIGKRGDLLVFGREEEPAADPKLDESQVIAADASLEVRSSSQEVKTWYAARQLNPSKRGRNALSFTPKTEDIAQIERWIRRYGVPHYYVQVFEDEVYAIPTLEILKIAGEAGNKNKSFWIEKNSGNQFKTTINVDIGCGQKIAELVEPPKNTAVRRVLPNGRVLRYVKPEGGALEMDVSTLKQLFDAGLKR